MSVVSVEIRNFSVWVIWLAVLLKGVPAKAQLPLEIEDLVAPEHAFKLSARFEYMQSRELVVPFSSPELHWPSPGFRRTETGSVVSRIRWGARKDLELNLSYGYQALDLTMDSPSQTHTREFLLLGGAWQISPDDRTPAVVLSIDVEALGSEFSGDDVFYGKAQSIGATVYRALDPVVLSINVAYTNFLPRGVDGHRLVPGERIAIQPQVNFAVNHRVSILGGVGCRIFTPSKLNGAAFTTRETLIVTQLGMGFQLGKRSMLFANTEFAVVGEESASLEVEWSYRF